MTLETNLGWAPIVAVLLWLATKLAEAITNYVADKRERQRFLLALHAEVDINVRDFKEQTFSMPSMDLIREKMALDATYAPYMTFTRVDGIYKSRLAFVHHAGTGTIPQIVSFYADLDRLAVEVAGVYTDAFKKISLDSRVATIEDLCNSSAKCIERGEEVLDLMEAALKYGSYRRLSANFDPPMTLDERLLRLKDALSKKYLSRP